MQGKKNIGGEGGTVGSKFVDTEEREEREREVLGKERLGSSGGKKEKGGSMGEEKREGNRVDKELGVFEGPRGGKGESEER